MAAAAAPRQSTAAHARREAHPHRRRPAKTPPSAASSRPPLTVILVKPYPFRGRAPGRRGPSSVRRPLRSSTPRPVLPARRPRTRFPERPDWPDPQSQSLSRSYGSRLPISLTYINLSTRGSEPRRPDAEMGTVCVETGSPQGQPKAAGSQPQPKPKPLPSQPRAAPSDSDPCDFLTYIFHGLALVHGTTQELCRSTATVWF